MELKEIVQDQVDRVNKERREAMERQARGYVNELIKYQEQMVCIQKSIAATKKALSELEMPAEVKVDF